MVRLSRRFSEKAGLAPGTPVFTGEKKTDEVRITIIDYDAEHFGTKESAKVEACHPRMEKSTVTWINVVGLHDISVAQELGSCYGWHPLIIEDILNMHQRTKMDILDDYILISLKMISYNSGANALDIEQISIVLGENYVITFQERADEIFEPVRNRLKNNMGRARKAGADYLAYALLDAIVDNYFRVLEDLGEEMEEMEEELVSNPTQDTMHRIHGLKKEMIFLRRSVWPLREMIGRLEREETLLIRETSDIYLRDLYDHTIQVIDTVETFRDMISGMLDIYLSSISNRMNEVMKVLTIFASIFIPLTFITGIYGMNFNTDKSPYNMPELGWYFGYPFALGLMAFAGILTLYYFKRKKWL